MTTQAPDENKLIAERRQKLAAIRARGVAFPNHARPTHKAAALHAAYHGIEDADQLLAAGEIRVAGRMMSKRVMGKASFTAIQDGSGARMQIYLSRDELPEGRYADFKTWDVGDIISARGKLFRTQTGELTIHADDVELLTKSLRPLPEKYHGLSDQETRYRQRYVDLITNEDSRNTFIIRSKIVSYIRRFFEARDFLEVETPMMHPASSSAALSASLKSTAALETKASPPGTTLNSPCWSTTRPTPTTTTSWTKPKNSSRDLRAKSSAARKSPTKASPLTSASRSPA